MKSIGKVRHGSGALRGACLAALIIVTAGEIGCAAPRSQPQQKMKAAISSSENMQYLLYLPAAYKINKKKKWPLIMFLHGSTEKGSDLEIVKRNGLPAFLEKNRSFPFIVVSPQLSLEEDWWDPGKLKMLLDAVLPGLQVDTDRLYLTGWSLGAYGTWYMAMSYPNLFAAIAPVAGGGDTQRASLLKAVPAWVFHGARDQNVPPEESQAMVEALKNTGDEVRFTLYPDMEHDSWTTAYNNPELYEWFLQHRKTHS